MVEAKAFYVKFQADHPDRRLRGGSMAGSEEERFIAGPVVLTWDPGIRLVCLTYAHDGIVTAKDAEMLTAAMGHWVGREGKPFGMLVDESERSIPDPGYRKIWMSYLNEVKDAALIALFDAPPALRISIEALAVGSGLQMRAFAARGEALAWLREKGFAK